jgi:hypothetical protein
MKVKLFIRFFLLIISLNQQILLFNCVEQTIFITEKWKKMIDSTRDWIKTSYNPISKNILVKMKHLVSEDCAQSVLASLDSLEQLDDWAMKSKKKLIWLSLNLIFLSPSPLLVHQVFNSWSSFPPRGLFSGTFTDFGSYDQCLSITPNSIIQEAQYCMIDLIPYIPQPQPVNNNLFHSLSLNISGFEALKEHASYFYYVSWRTGICLPSKCSREEITLVVKKGKKNELESSSASNECHFCFLSFNS